MQKMLSLAVNLGLRSAVGRRKVSNFQVWHVRVLVNGRNSFAGIFSREVGD